MHGGVHAGRAANRLRSVVRLDAAAAGLVALVMLVFMQLMRVLLGLSLQVVGSMALVNAAYAALGAWLLWRGALASEVRWLASANLAWAAVCACALVGPWRPLQPLGLLYVAAEGVFVLLLGTAERRLCARVMQVR